MPPIRSTAGAAGYDLCSCEDIIIEPGGVGCIDLGLSIQLPQGTYGRIAPRSGLAFRKNDDGIKPYLDVQPGVIDEDYRGSLKVILHNLHDTPATIYKRTRIAQLILEKIETPEVSVENTLSATKQQEKAFGSTGMEAGQEQPTGMSNPQACIINNAEVLRPELIKMDLDGDGPYLDVEIRIKGEHPTLGLNVTQGKTGQLTLINCKPGTPAARIPKWRSTLRNARVKKLHNTNIKTNSDLIKAIEAAKIDKIEYVRCKFATEKRVDMHPQDGIPQLHFDQLSVIARHHYEARTGERFFQVVEPGIPSHHTVELNKLDTSKSP